MFFSRHRFIPSKIKKTQFLRLLSSPVQSLAKIKRLRLETNSPLKDCLQALNNTHYDYQKAHQWLRQNDKIIYSDVSHRKTENLAINITLAPDKKSACIMEIATETDFVPRNEIFRDSVYSIGNSVLMQPERSASLENLVIMKSNLTAMDLVRKAASSLRENIKIRNISFLSLSGSPGVVSGYTHNSYFENIGSKGAIVAMKSQKELSPDNTEWLRELARKIAMHIVASNPLYLNVSRIPLKILEKEKLNLRAETVNSFAKRKQFKSEKMIEKVVENKLKAHCSKICLEEQSFIFDEKSRETVFGAIDRQCKEKGISHRVFVDDFVCYG